MFLCCDAKDRVVNAIIAFNQELGRSFFLVVWHTRFLVRGCDYFGVEISL